MSRGTSLHTDDIAASNQIPKAETDSLASQPPRSPCTATQARGTKAVLGPSMSDTCCRNGHFLFSGGRIDENYCLRRLHLRIVLGPFLTIGLQLRDPSLILMLEAIASNDPDGARRGGKACLLAPVIKRPNIRRRAVIVGPDIVQTLFLGE